MAELHGHAIAPVHVLLRPELKLVEGVVHALPEAPDLEVAHARVGALVIGKHPLDVGIAVLERRVEVAPVVRLDVVPGLVDVLLGHSQAQFYRFGGDRRAAAAPRLTQGSSWRFVRTPSSSTRSQPCISRPRITNGCACGFSTRASVSSGGTRRRKPPRARAATDMVPA